MGKHVLNYISQICLWLGFLIPFFTSHYVGMPMSRMPLVSTATIVLWAAGLVIRYYSYLEEKKVTPKTPLWLRLSGYLTSIPATFVLLGILFGLVYYPTVERTVAKSVNFLMIATLFVMGVQITPQDWKGILQRPKAVSVAVAIRWIGMPLIAWILGNVVLLRYFPQPIATTLAIGLVLLGTTPTGVGSNTLTLISRGDLALSVSVTTVNTVIAPFLQPVMIKALVGKATHVDAYGIFLDLIEVVLVPVILGSIVGSFWPDRIRQLKPALVAGSVLCLTFVIMGTTSRGTANLLRNLWILPVLVGVCMVQAIAGLSLGYYLPKVFGMNHKQRVASCFEVGIENGSLTMVLAVNHFNPLAAVPSVVYAKLMNFMAITFFVRKFQQLNDEEAGVAVTAQPQLASAKAPAAHD